MNSIFLPPFVENKNSKISTNLIEKALLNDIVNQSK